jgi:hypothetical protein
MGVQTAQSIIQSALRKITAFQSGDQLAAMDANDGLEVLNDLLDSLAVQRAYVFSSIETIVDFSPLDYQYTIGPGGVFSVDTSGNPIARPNRITAGFTRLSSQAGGIDFPLEVTMDQKRYNDLTLKNVPGPWPIALYYNPTFPLGTLYFYPNPASAAELHLWIDQIVQSFATLNTAVSLPPGYSRALKWLLAKEICSEYGYPITEAIKEQTEDAVNAIKTLNRLPVPVSKYDPSLMYGRRGDAGWYLDGGFH